MEEGVQKVTVTGKNLFSVSWQGTIQLSDGQQKDEVAIARGLAWTQVGGDTLQIEVNVMPGKGELLLTGQLGDVMKESAQAGITTFAPWRRNIMEQGFFQEHDIHVHIPEGAVPKDSPSAGITMATAILSAVTRRPVRADIAMTGEITLRGRVLPIGRPEGKASGGKICEDKRGFGAGTE